MSASPAIKCLIVDDLEEKLIALEALLAEPGVEVSARGTYRSSSLPPGSATNAASSRATKAARSTSC